MQIVPEGVRRQAIQKALDGHAEKADAERLRIEWKAGYENIPVVDLSLDLVLLNPRNRRIQSQLESHPDVDKVRDDPFSNESQAIIAQILAQQVDGFDDLCRNLKDRKQREAGIITREGLLINANRRAVALRAIGVKYIRVGVLPVEDGDQELVALEESLQMQRDYKVDYTFTNWLLYVFERTERGATADELASRFGWAVSSNKTDLDKGAKKVRQHLRILAIIRRLQAQASSSLALTLFDSKQIALEELDNEIESLGAGTAKAERVLQMRTAAMLCDVGYRELRLIEEDFIDEYLFEHLSEDQLFGPCADYLTSGTPTQKQSNAGIPAGVDLLVTGSQDLATRSPEPLLEFVLEAVSEGHAAVPIGCDGQRWVLQRDNLGDSLGSIINDAVEEAKDAQRHSDRLAAPLAYLEGARKKIKKAEEALDQVKGHVNLDYGSLKYSAKKLAGEAKDLHERVNGLR